MTTISPKLPADLRAPSERRSLAAASRSIAAPIRWVLRFRLLQFFAIGGTLFALSPPAGRESVIEVRSARVDALARREATRLGVAELSADQMATLRSRIVEDDVLVAEARRMGLDKGDDIVRQRLVQKMLFLAEDLGGASRPASEADFRAFYEVHPELYRLPVRADFIHVFAKQRETLVELLPAVASWDAEHPSDPPPLGEPFPRGRRLSVRVSELEPSWGTEFTQELGAADVGVWGQPVSSRYGFHLLKVLRRSSDGVATYEESRSRIPLDLLRTRREEAAGSIIATLMKQYKVTMDGQPFDGYRPSIRTAFHTTSADED